MIISLAMKLILKCKVMKTRTDLTTTQALVIVGIIYVLGMTLTLVLSDLYSISISLMIAIVSAFVFRVFIGLAAKLFVLLFLSEDSNQESQNYDHDPWKKLFIIARRFLLAIFFIKIIFYYEEMYKESREIDLFFDGCYWHIILIYI